MGVVLGQNLGEIKFNVVKKSKETGTIGFSRILHGEYILKQVVVKRPEWKFKASIARNAIFQGCHVRIRFLPKLGQK